MIAMSYSFVTIVSIFLIFDAACGIIYRVGTLRLHITEDIMYERTIDGHMLREMLAGGLANLKANADEINDLNVFPIPDGDTGDNMVSTLSGGLRAVGEAVTLSSLPSQKKEDVAEELRLRVNGLCERILSGEFDKIK